MRSVPSPSISPEFLSRERRPRPTIRSQPRAWIASLEAAGPLKHPLLAWQIEQAMKEKNISRNSLAQRMKTSRSQIGRLLDPKDGNVTLTTLQRAARMVGRSLRLELV
jgi:ParB-like chromosome segregation protein Spo0J